MVRPPVAVRASRCTPHRAIVCSASKDELDVASVAIYRLVR
ncbi:MAG TPA: hypothetical protein VMN60_09575 [Longimicrobiales bacterium]|nr:hypothetical protein [Longimicrobiales bacterium]